MAYILDLESSVSSSWTLRVYHLLPHILSSGLGVSMAMAPPNPIPIVSSGAPEDPHQLCHCDNVPNHPPCLL